jgi:hypothetical protein
MWIQKPAENLPYKYVSLPVMTNIPENMYFKSYIVFVFIRWADRTVFYFM